MAPFLHQQYPCVRRTQRTSYGFRLDNRCLPRVEGNRLRDQEHLQHLVVQLTNPWASATQSPGFDDFTELISDYEELKSLTFFSINGAAERAHPLYGGALPHSLLLALTPRNLTTVCFSNVHLPCAELTGFLRWTPAKQIRFSYVSFTPNPKGGPLLSNEALELLELSNVPDQLVDELVRGINPRTKGFHLKLHPEGRGKLFKQSLWEAVYPRKGQWRPSVGSITTITFAGGPVFSEATTVFSDLAHSNVVYFGMEDAQFDDRAFDAFLRFVGDKDGHLRSLRVRYWNTEISNNAHNGSEFERFLRAISDSKIKEYIHEGISSCMANIVAHHLPSLGLSACHLEITPPPGTRKYGRGLARNPAEELMVAARNDKTLGVFDESDYSNNMASLGPGQDMPPTVLFPYDMKPKLVGLSAIGIINRQYGDSGVTGGHWDVFSEDQLDELARLVKRNNNLNECQREGHVLPAPSAISSPTNKVVARLNSIVYSNNMAFEDKIFFKGWTDAVLRKAQYWNDYIVGDDNDLPPAAAPEPVFSLPSPSSLATTASIHSYEYGSDGSNDDDDNYGEDSHNINGKRRAPK